MPRLEFGKEPVPRASWNERDAPACRRFIRRMLNVSSIPLVVAKSPFVKMK